MKSFSISKIIAATLGAIIVILAVAFTIQAQNAALNIKPGSKLTYTMQGATMTEAVVIVNSLTPTISFKWTGADNLTGKVIASDATYNSGRKMASMLFDDAKGDFTFFWLSKAMFTELNQGKTAYYMNNGANMSGVVNGGVEQMQIKVNGVLTTVSVIHAKSVTATGGEEFFVLNDPANPLILKLKSSQGGFILKEITE